MSQADGIAQFLACPRENRHAVRYPLRAKVSFTWVDRRGVRREQSAWSRNLSPRGAYIQSLILPEVGSRLTLTLYLPPSDGRALPIEMLIEGRVVRTAGCMSASGDGGFALSNERVSVCQS